MDVHALVLEVDAADEDTVVGLFASACLGAQVAHGTDGRTTIRVYLAEAPDGAAARRALRAAGIEADRSSVSVERVPDEPWVERYQRTLVPFPLGRQFQVDPGGDVGRALPAGKIGLRLAPGRAFGTGEHATTRLCVAALEDLVRPGQRWLDLGCGTGILALVAWHCGARHVRAVDSDPEALLVAREVLRANDLAESIDLGQATTTDGLGALWDGVVANLDERTLVREARALAALVAAQGVLVCSGFLEPDAPEVVAALAAVGLGTCVLRAEGGWAAAVAARP